MPVNSLVHPSDRQLSEFVSGRLPENERSVVEEHVIQCDVCCDTLDRIDDDRLSVLARMSSVMISATNTQGESQTQVRQIAAPTVPEDLIDHPRYDIGECLGVGGMGTVFKAHHRMMDRTVALKVIHPELANCPDTQRQFHVEVKAAARLSHPSIVTAYDAEQAGETLLLVMEYVNGQSLSEVVLRDGPLPVESAIQTVEQVAYGLQHAGELGLVHRDIKPSNLILVNDAQAWTVKILDFGLARIQQESHESLRESQANSSNAPGLSRHDSIVLGTLHYMSPEQFENPSQADIRSDIYSLGCTLHYLLTARPPFWGESFFDRIRPRNDSPGKLICQEHSHVPAAVGELVDRMLAVNPENRFQEPKEILDSIASWIAPAAPPPAKRLSQKWIAGILVVAMISLFSIGLLINRPNSFFAKPKQSIEFPTPVPQMQADVHVLLLAPSVGLWREDYEPIVAQLVKAGVSVQVASTQKTVSVADSSGIVGTLQVNQLVADSRADHFDAIVACGGDWSELDSSPSALKSLSEIIQDQAEVGQVVGAICGGEEVLARVGLLQGRRIAPPPPTIQTNSWGANVMNGATVVWDENLVTAGDPDDAIEFSNELLKRFGINVPD